MNNLHAKVMARYEAIRNKEEAALKARKTDIYQRIPRIEELERLMSLNSLNVARTILKNQDQVDHVIARLKSQNMDLRQEKMELLVSHGYPMDYMDLKYNCDKCKDLGYISGNKCFCYNHHLAEIVYAESDFSHMLNEDSFATFDEAVFDNQSVHPEYGLTVRQNMKRTLNLAKSYAQNFLSHTDNLYLYGPSGTGKTFLATCIARSLLADGQVVVYRTSSQLMDDIKDIMFNNNKELENLLHQSDLLIIDDLGTESPTDHTKTEIFNLVNLRLLHKKKLIISSNLKLDDIRHKYSERLTSRIIGDFILVPFFGEDLRHLKGRKKNLNFRNRLSKQKF